MKEFLFKPDAAILVCSDGLSDLLTSAEMLEVMERYDGDPAQVADELVEAANLAGGTDNITKARDDEVAAPGRRSVARVLTTRVAFLIYGFVLGVVLALALRWPKP